MFCLGVVICVAGICRLWYTSVYLRSYDALCPSHLGHILYGCTDDVSGNGATLYAIVAIETSIGIICGCLPGCKPLMTKMFPHFFESTQSATRPSQKKASRMDGQSFPFQSLSGGIIKEEDYRVEYGDRGSRPYDKTTLVTADSSKRRDGDAISADSQAWIMMQDNPNGATGSRADV